MNLTLPGMSPYSILDSFFLSNENSVADWGSDNELPDDELPNDLNDNAPADYGSTTSESDTEQSWSGEDSSGSLDDSDDESVEQSSDVMHITIYYYRINHGDRSKTRALRSAASSELQPRADNTMPVLSFEGCQAQLIDWDSWNYHSRLYFLCLRFVIYEDWLFLSLAVAAQIFSSLF